MKQKSKNKKIVTAERVSFLFFSFCFLMLFLGLVRVSIPEEVDGRNLRQMAANRRTRKVTIPAKRGSILDIDGNLLASNVSSYTVFAYLSDSRTKNPNNPAHVVDKEMTARALSSIIDMSEERILHLLNLNLYQVELGPGGRNIGETTKEEISKLKLPGISFIENQRRYYPNGDFASYVTGYAKKNMVEVDGEEIEQIVGELGVESMYDSILRGEDGFTEYQVSIQGFRIPGTTAINNPPIDGSNIYLTIDSNIQRFLEDAVKENDRIYNPEWLMVIAMDAKTGNILGSATTPSYNPNLLNITNYENPMTSFAFEPGSTMKTYTYACAMEKGTYDGNATFDSKYIRLTDDTIYNWHRDGWGEINYELGYEYSANVGIGHMLQNKISGGDLKDCLDDYGFGRLTGISLPRERPGQVSFRYDSEIVAAGYGQGITTTAIQHMQAMTMFANNGEMIKPRIIERIETSDGEIAFENSVVSKGQVISPSTANEMKRLMYNVIHEDNPGTTGRPYKIEGLDLIGKTATAQIYDFATGRYSTGNNNMIYSFSGMFPYDDPEIIIYSAVKKPTWGRNTAVVNATRDIVSSIAKYKNIKQENINNGNLQDVFLSNYVNRDPELVRIELSNDGLNPIVIGDGNRVLKQSHMPNTRLLVGDRVFLVTNYSQFELPRLRGYSSYEVRKLLDMVNISYNINGFGFVTEYTVDEDGVYNIELRSRFND